MCDYCDCRDLAPIRELSDEHARIDATIGELRDGLAAGDEAGAVAALARLQAALGPHLAKEEAGLFAELGRRPGFVDYLRELRRDHEHARAGLLAMAGPVARWATEVPGALDELVTHIGMEEYDLFPASRLILDDAAWAEVAAAHRRSDAAPAGEPAIAVLGPPAA